MSLDRREFLKRGITFVTLSLTSKHMMMQVTPGGDSVFGQASAQSGSNNLLVIIQLNGGNDGLNTVVPYSNGLYYDARPSLNVPQKGVLPLNNDLGLHPKLANLKKLYDGGKVAIINGVGYLNSSRSHFRGTDIWMSANPDKIERTGWIGRFLDESIARFHNVKTPAANIGGVLPLTLRSTKVVVPSIVNLQSFQLQTDPKYAQDRANRLQLFTQLNSQPFDAGAYLALIAQTGLGAHQSAEELQQAVKKYKSTVQYPTDPFSQGLKLIAQIIAAGVGTQIMHVAIGGFDTHANQSIERPVSHQTLLERVDAGMNALYQDLTQMGIANDVLIMTFSEFGRRVRENGSQGTDHGTAAPLFALGNRVKGGLFGQYPSLSQLDNNGDLIHTVDFRSVYATVLEDWLKADSKSILRGNFENLGFVAK